MFTVGIKWVNLSNGIIALASISKEFQEILITIIVIIIYLVSLT